MNLIEFVGPPGSGKSYFYKNFKNYLKLKNIKSKTPLDSLLEVFYKKKTSSKKKKQKLYFIYLKNLKLNSNYLFKKESAKFLKFLDKNTIQKKDFNLILNKYQKYIQDSYLPNNFVIRMINNFKINYLGLKFAKKTNDLIISEEGIFQKVYLNFISLKNLDHKKNILKILTKLTKPRLILYFNLNFNLCIKRARKRKRGFNYFHNKKFLLQKKNFFNNYIFHYAKKNNIKIIEINSNKDPLFYYKKLFKYIELK